MGDRGQVLIKETGVYLYTHSGGSELVHTVRDALTKRWRWNDMEYLARIIFDEMVRGQAGTETGFGISNSKHDDVWLLITIGDDEVLIEKDGEEVYKGTFEDFIKTDFEVIEGGE